MIRHVESLTVLLTFVCGATAMAECNTIKLDEAHNTFRPLVGLVTQAKYDIPVCEVITVDVSDYMAGGVGLEGRPPANFLYVQIQDGESRVDISRVLQPDERVVRVSPRDGKLVVGSREIMSLAPGQGVVFVIGVKLPTNFDTHSMSGGFVRQR